MFRFRPSIGNVTLSLVTAAYILIFLNFSFWSRAIEYFGDNRMALISVMIGMFAVHAAIFVFASTPLIFKPLLLFFVISAGFASWFMDQFGVIIDDDMIRNAMETTPAEANNLITPKFLAHIFFYALIPSLLIILVRIPWRSPIKQAMWNLKFFVPLMAIFLIAAFGNMAVILSTFRNHNDLLKYLNPDRPIVSTLNYFFKSYQEKNFVLKQIGLDAKIGSPRQPGEKPRIVILVVGETARAMNFSLNGYARETNPELKKHAIINFPNTTSCGTATATSVPCMFSNATRAGYKHHIGLSQENVLDVLNHAGVHVEWWDNNTGDKKVASRIKMVSYRNGKDPILCIEGECQDDILFNEFEHWLDNAKGDSVLVLHTMGSHGPAYFKRYPDKFAVFKPDCRTAELGDCTSEQILNAYDNTILYTDHFLADIITRLKEREASLASAMVYMSDHGESLGEKGLYLHGAPYMLAPAEQTSIPFLMWISPDFTQRNQLNLECLAKESNANYSHDNLFHTLLGLMDVNTDVHDKNLDITASCKGSSKP